MNKGSAKDQMLYQHDQAKTHPAPRSGFLASGSVVGAVLVSSCCILPLVLLSLGVGGAWMSNLTALAPYQPYFIAMTLLMLGAGFYSVYRKPRDTRATEACGTGAYCGTSLAKRVTKVALWSATVLVVLALAWPYIASYFLN